MNTGRGFLLASVAIAFSWLSHLIVGYGVSVLTILIIATDLPHWRTSLLRWIKMNAFAGVCITYLVVPTMLEKHVLNRSLWEPPAYWDSYGFWNISRWLFEGKLLDSLEEREVCLFFVAPAFFSDISPLAASILHVHCPVHACGHGRSGAPLED